MSERLDVSMQFNGKAEDAARLYGDVFGKQASIMKFKEFPTFDQMENVEPVAVGRAEIIFDNANLILTDCTYPEITPGNNITLNWWADDESRFYQVWDAFVEGRSTVSQHPQTTFFSKLQGSLTDPFGISWTILYNPSTQTEG